MDAAVFSDEIVQPLSDPALEFTLSGPFERVPKLKPKIEARPYGCQIRREQSGFDELWKPGSRPRRHCFAFIGQHRALQRQGPIQLDRVEPNASDYDYKVVAPHKKALRDFSWAGLWCARVRAGAHPWKTKSFISGFRVSNGPGRSAMWSWTWNKAAWTSGPSTSRA
jgi:hypothetical protein